MKPVTRIEILDYETYAEERPGWQERAMAAKGSRRVHLGDALTFLFENRDTVRYQVQEVVLAERLVRERAIREELDACNALLGGEGELGCSLLIEIPDPEERARKLEEWRNLPESTYVRLPNGERVAARFDPRQKGEERLSAVQFLKFDTKGEVPVAVGVEMPAFTVETPLSPEQRRALEIDLAQ